MKTLQSSIHIWNYEKIKIQPLNIKAKTHSKKIVIENSVENERDSIRVYGS
jgi:hypothetical protein